MKRVFFINKKDRNNFFNKIKNSQKSWRKIALLIGTNRSMIDNYRSGKLCIPEDRLSKLIDLVPAKEKEYFNKKIKYKDSNWGQIIGGKKAYVINKDKFDIGREKGSKTVKYDFNINMPLSKGLCEFIGAIIGDGFTNKYNHTYQTQITGDKILDEKYYHKTLSPICEKEFNIKPIIKKREDRITLTIYSKRLFELLTKRFNFPHGIKSYTIKIPDEILKSHEELINSTLRGMFDTDGGIGLDKRKIYKKPYIRINYTSASNFLIDQIHNILENYNIPHSIHEKKDSPAKQIQINGEENVKRFISKIGFSNPRHLNKIKHLI